MATTKEREETEAMARAAARRNGGGDRPRGTRADALDVIFASAEELGEGFRTGALGTPRFGKTYHLKEVVSAAQDRGIVELALIHDCKRTEPQYDGVLRLSTMDLAARPLRPDDEPTIVFHREPGAGGRCEVNDVALFGLDQGRRGTATLVLIDELYHGLKARQTWAAKPSAMAEIMREGSSQRVSSAWTTQIPQALPTEMLDLSETIAVFMLNGRSLTYACEQMRLPPDAEPVIKGLARGEFILWTANEGWDGVIYGPG